MNMYGILWRNRSCKRSKPRNFRIPEASQPHLNPQKGDGMPPPGGHLQQHGKQEGDQE